MCVLCVLCVLCVCVCVLCVCAVCAVCVCVCERERERERQRERERERDAKEETAQALHANTSRQLPAMNIHLSTTMKKRDSQSMSNEEARLPIIES